MGLFDQRGQTVIGTQVNVGKREDFDQRGQTVKSKTASKPKPKPQR